MSIDPHRQAKIDLAEELTERVGKRFAQVPIAAIIIDFVAAEFESLDSSHAATTATYRLVKRPTPTQVEVNRQLFEEAVRGQLLEYVARFSNWDSAPDVDSVVDEIAAIAVEHHPFI